MLSLSVETKYIVISYNPDILSRLSGEVKQPAGWELSFKDAPSPVTEPPVSTVPVLQTARPHTPGQLSSGDVVQRDRDRSNSVKIEFQLVCWIIFYRPSALYFAGI